MSRRGWSGWVDLSDEIRARVESWHDAVNIEEGSSGMRAYLKALHRPGITSLLIVTISRAHCSDTLTRRPSDNKAAHRTDDMPSCSNGSMRCNAPSEYRASAFCKAGNVRKKKTDESTPSVPLRHTLLRNETKGTGLHPCCSSFPITCSTCCLADYSWKIQSRTCSPRDNQHRVGCQT